MGSWRVEASSLFCPCSSLPSPLLHTQGIGQEWEHGEYVCDMALGPPGVKQMDSFCHEVLLRFSYNCDSYPMRIPLSLFLQQAICYTLPQPFRFLEIHPFVGLL